MGKEDIKLALGALARTMAVVFIIAMEGDEKAQAEANNMRAIAEELADIGNISGEEYMELMEYEGMKVIASFRSGGNTYTKEDYNKDIDFLEVFNEALA